MFQQVDAAESYSGTQASCVPVSRAAESFTVRIPNRSLVNDRGNNASIRVGFKQSRKVNPAYSNGSIQQWIITQIDGSGAN